MHWFTSLRPNKVSFVVAVLWMVSSHLLFLSPGFAAISNALPQSVNRISVEVLSTSATGASLAVGTSDPGNLPNEALVPYSGGIIWAVPQGTVQVGITLHSQGWRELLPGEVPDSVIAQVLAEPQPLMAASDVMRLRDIPLISLGFNALQPNEGGDGVRVCEHYEAELTYVSGGAQEERLVSSAFWSLARGVAGNLDEVLPEPVLQPEPYLIITSPTYVGVSLNNFVAWKRARGHLVRVATTDETGTTAQQILNYLQTAYDTWDVPPVFVLLIGDEDGGQALATWEVPGFYTATIASDHPYTLLDGTDFLPDVFIGRFSVDTQAELQTVVNKCINYESQPFEPVGKWRSRMLTVGVRSSPTFFPTYNSSWPTLQWIARNFLENGYSDIDSVPYPPGNSTQINNSVNNGVSFIAYRGFGSPSDWAFPPYTNDNINSLTNGAKLPVVMSIVCGGGAFSDEVDPCFGEKWLRLGTPSTPKGAVGFIGPSELDTKTRWNNTNIAGIVEGILHEGVNALGAAMLRGKMELVRQFPNNVNNHEADSDRSVSFYFKCYNLLGDPGLTFFVGPVRDLAADAPPQLPAGTAGLDLYVTEDGTPLADAWGTLTAFDTIYSRGTSAEDGHLVLSIPQTGEDTVLVTVTKPRHEPQRYSIVLAPQGIVISAAQTELVDDNTNGSIGNGDENVNPGERIATRFVLRNYGSSTYPGGSLQLLADSPWLTIVTPSVNVPSLPAGGQTPPLNVLVDIEPNAPDQTTAITTASVDAEFLWPVSFALLAPTISVATVRMDGIPSNPEPNATSQFELELANIGHLLAPAATVTLHSLDSRLILLDSIATYPAVDIGGSAVPTDGGYTVQVGDLYPGDWLPVEITLSAQSFEAAVSYSLPIGNLSDTDPTHPDGYGYRMFQSGDLSYSEAPDYAWVEIDPQYGGPGAVLPITDHEAGRDTTTTIDLPFAFQFYGVVYDEISICTNGFVSFGNTDESYFRNYSLPAIASPDNMVCVFWDDLRTSPARRVYTYYDEDGGRFIIEWSRLINGYGQDIAETCQLHLFDPSCWPTRTGDGNLVIQYLEFNNVDSWDNYATVGLQDRDQGYVLPVTYAGDTEPGVSMLGPGQALLFTTGRPVDGAYVAYAGNVVDDDNEGGSSGNDDGIPQNAETVELQIQLENSGSEDAPPFAGILVENDPLITLLDSAVSFPTIPAGGTAAAAPVRVVIDSHTPHGHSAGFFLSLSGGAQPCAILPSVQISAPFLTLAQMLVNDDGTPPSNGNGNGEFNGGELIELFPEASNLGGNAAQNVQATLRRLSTGVVVLDSMAAIGTIGIGEQHVAQDPFLVQVAGGLQDGHSVSFSVKLRDVYGNEWQQSVSYLVVRPLLSSDGARIADPEPQGNGDGRLIGGESGQVFPRVMNAGMGAAANVVVTLSTLDTTVSIENTVIPIGTVSAQSSREADTPLLIAVFAGLNEPRSVLLNMTITADDGIVVNEELPVTVGDVLYFESFESDLDGWSIYGTEDLWHLQSREFASPSHAFYCGEESELEYPPSADAYLRSPMFTFSGTGQLTFSTRFQTASNEDVCRVHLQTGYTTYHLLDTFHGDGSEWQQRTYSLAGLPASDMARIRFWFESDFSDNDEGWYVDDVILLDEPQVVAGSLPALIPETLTLSPAYPNPFNHRATIEFGLPQSQRVVLTLFDITGRRVAILLDEQRAAGFHRVAWQPLQLASGLYLIRVDAGLQSRVGKILYLK